MDKLTLIDGNSILNRAYYAIPPLNDKQGRNVNAVYGFTNILLKVISDYKPTHLAVAFDMKGKNFRHELFSDYKANRKGMPDDLAQQMPILHDLLKTMQITIVEKVGAEADDIIGTLSKRFSSDTLIVTGDRDLLQLVDDSTTVLLTKKGITEVEKVDTNYLQEVYHLTPKQIIEFKSLRGDPSDNIPGVKGIGEKTAQTLIDEYGDLDNVYENIDKIKGSVKDKLLADKDMAYISHELATINTKVDIECDYDLSRLKPFNNAVKEMFDELEFRTLVKRLTFDSSSSIVSENTDTYLKPTSIKVTTLDKIAEVVTELNKADKLSVFFGSSITIATTSDSQYEFVISDNFLDGINFEEVLKALKPIFESSIDKVVYDGKANKHMLIEYGFELNNIIWDISIMQYLVEYRAFKEVKALTDNYGVEADACGLWRIGVQLESQLKSTDTLKLYEEIELPLMQVLYEMEVEGVKVDTATLKSLNNRFNDDIASLTAQVFELAGEEFNILSPKQLAKILFEKLQLPSGKKTKTGFSTDNDVLMKIIDLHPIIPLIIKIRQLSKLNGTYIEGMKPLIAANDLLHTSYNQTLTSTGRLSSSEPNLQNIPIREDVGKLIRKMFVSKYGELVSADYSQIELRLLANFSDDANLIKTFNDGIDIHAKVASEIFGVPLEMVNSKMRRTAKAVNFGIIYGISDYGLGENVGISTGKAKEYIRKYFASYPTIKKYLDSSVEQARANGYVTTIAGRRRQIPEINSANYQLRSFGERAAMNMPLQGSAADIMKIAMINVYNGLKKANLKSKIIMQVHDELVVDCYDDEVDKVKVVLKEEMENAMRLKVKLTVNLECGENLYDAK